MPTDLSGWAFPTQSLHGSVILSEGGNKFTPTCLCGWVGDPMMSPTFAAMRWRNHALNWLEAEDE